MPKENPTTVSSVANEWTDDLTDDFGIPIYKAPIEINNVVKPAAD